MLSRNMIHKCWVVGVCLVAFCVIKCQMGNGGESFLDGTKAPKGRTMPGAIPQVDRSEKEVARYDFA